MEIRIFRFSTLNDRQSALPLDLTQLAFKQQKNITMKVEWLLRIKKKYTKNELI